MPTKTTNPTPYIATYHYDNRLHRFSIDQKDYLFYYRHDGLDILLILNLGKYLQLVEKSKQFIKFDQKLHNEFQRVLGFVHKFEVDNYNFNIPTDVKGKFEFWYNHILNHTVGQKISFYTHCGSNRELMTGIVEYQDQLGFVVTVNNTKYELKQLINITKVFD